MLNIQSPTSVSIVCMLPDFFLFKNWGFTSCRGKMKINILLCVKLVSWSPARPSGLWPGGSCCPGGLRLAEELPGSCHPRVGLKEVDSFKMAENLQVAVATVLRMGSRVWEKEGSRKDCGHFSNPLPFPSQGSLPSNILFWENFNPTKKSRGWWNYLLCILHLAVGNICLINIL